LFISLKLIYNQQMTIIIIINQNNINAQMNKEFAFEFEIS